MHYVIDLQLDSYKAVLQQLRAALDQRPFEKVLAWNRTPERLKRLEAAAQEKGLPFKSVTLEQLCRQADVVVTITSSFSPMIAG